MRCRSTLGADFQLRFSPSEARLIPSSPQIEYTYVRRWRLWTMQPIARLALNLSRSRSSMGTQNSSACRPPPSTRKRHFLAFVKFSLLENNLDWVFGVSLKVCSTWRRFSGVEAVDVCQYSRALVFFLVEIERRGMYEDRRRRWRRIWWRRKLKRKAGLNGHFRHEKNVGVPCLNFWWAMRFLWRG